jgi:hypothetical protein
MIRKATKKSRVIPTKGLTHEWHLHAAMVDYLTIVQQLNGGLAFHHSPNEGKRTKRGQRDLKRLGTQAGEPDLALYLPGATTTFVEVKAARTPLSDAQKERHAVLRALGFRVEIIRAASSDTAIAALAALLRELGVRSLPRLAA